LIVSCSNRETEGFSGSSINTNNVVQSSSPSSCNAVVSIIESTDSNNLSPNEYSEIELKSFSKLPFCQYKIALEYLKADENNKAIIYFELAALRGNRASQKKLAEIYEKGNLTAIDYNRAYLYNYLYYNQLIDLEYEAEDKKQNFQNITSRLTSQFSKQDKKWVEKQILIHNNYLQEYNRVISDYGRSVSVARRKNKTDYDIKNSFTEVINDNENHFDVATDYLKKGNTSKAISHYEISARHGNKSAQIILARKFKEGDGVEQDLRRAYMYYSLVYQHPGIHGTWPPQNDENPQDIINNLRKVISKEDRLWATKEIARHRKEHVWWLNETLLNSVKEKD